MSPHQSGLPADDPIVLVRELTRLGARLQHVMSRRTGLSPADLSALDILSREVVGPAELARQLGVSTAAATGIADRLEARGHVERHPIPGDRRRTALHLTSSGSEETRSHLRVMIDGLRDLGETFTDRERDVVRRYLGGAVAIIDEALGFPDASGAPRDEDAPRD